MKKHYGSIILLLILVLTIGFAIVTTNLIVNGSIKIGGNTSDFDVYFSDVTTDEGGSAVLSNNDRTITYNTKSLVAVGDVATLDYVVFNNSANYDAEVSVNWTVTDTISGIDYSSYYTIERTGFNTNNPTTVLGKTGANGSIVITLNKPVTESIHISFVMTLNANALERTETAVYVPPYVVESGDLDTVGSVVKIADEEFYVIGQEDATHVKLLSKYNLNVGNNIQTGTEGIQNSLAIGYNSDSTTRVDNYYPATVSFSSTNYWDGTPSYPSYIYINEKVNDTFTASIAEYIENYVEYLNNHGVKVTGRLMGQDDLLSLGCSDTLYYCDEAHGGSAPEWVYSTSYWLGSANSYDYVGVLHIFGDFSSAYYTDNDDFGVRPLIILKK